MGNEIAVLDQYDRYYLSYSGIDLPLKLVGDLLPGEVENRNTYFGVLVDTQNQPVLIHKVVYGEVYLQHIYEFDDSQTLISATITTEDGDTFSPPL